MLRTTTVPFLASATLSPSGPPSEARNTSLMRSAIRLVFLACWRDSFIIRNNGRAALQVPPPQIKPSLTRADSSPSPIPTVSRPSAFAQM